MKKFYYRLIAGFATTVIVYGIFFSFQVSFAQGRDQKQEARADSINKQSILKLNNEVIQSLELKVEGMEKYVDAGQKNLDLWLKLLSFILTVLIGFSVYSGLKARDLAKEELNDIKELRISINREANDAEDRLKIVNDKLIIIENSVTNAKRIEEEATEMLDGLANKEILILDGAQKKTIDDTIARIKDDLQKTGFDSLKNLYFAKGIRASGDKKWEEAVRLLTLYIDLNETNKSAFFNRAFAYDEIAEKFSGEEKKELLRKSIDDLSEVIRLDPNHASAYNNRADAYEKVLEYEKALQGFTEAIRLAPKKAKYYENRASLYTTMKRDKEAEQDYAKATELKKSKAKSA